jgi:hypothetical protein
LLEIIDSDYAFLNETLARHYGIDGVEGRRHQRVELSPEDLRGGILTQGTFLAVTSNPDRTSPVKRGQFILENLLGTPAAAPPPDIPTLEDSTGNQNERALTLRESLAIHRENPVCSSCHNRMDPLGLAFENFNAMGRHRETEFGIPIDPAGTLASGEAFASVKELKQVLIAKRKTDIYRCITEKLMIYALGRPVEYADIPQVDLLVNDLLENDGQAQRLLLGLIKSPAFQQVRTRPVANLRVRDAKDSSKP